MKRHTDYTAVFADWLWHACVPVVAYAVLVASAFALRHQPTPDAIADPAFLAELRTAAYRITLAAGETKRLDLKTK